MADHGWGPILGALTKEAIPDTWVRWLIGGLCGLLLTFGLIDRSALVSRVERVEAEQRHTISVLTDIQSSLAVVRTNQNRVMAQLDEMRADLATLTKIVYQRR